MADNGDRTIKQWMEIFSDLYSKSDSDRTPEQIWIAVMAHSSSIGESIRKDAYRELLRNAAHTFCWLCSFVNRCNTLEGDIFSIKGSLCEIITVKYPHMCGHCESNPCTCNPIKMDAETNKSARYERLMLYRKDILPAIEQHSIAAWKGIFAKIFGTNVHMSSLESIGFHFLEEVGECAVGVRKLSQLKRVADAGEKDIDTKFLQGLNTIGEIYKGYKKYYQPYESQPLDSLITSHEVGKLKARIAEAKWELLVEIGDTFSWFCAILNKLDSISKNSEFELLSLEETLNDEYIGEDDKARCPTCKTIPCSCLFFS